MSSHFYHLVREVSRNLYQLDTSPLTGSSPPFPWGDFSMRLGKALDRKELEIVPKGMVWKSKEDLTEGLGDSPVPLVFSIPPCKGEGVWIMAKQDIALLTSILLTKESHTLPLDNLVLNESFYRFLAIEALYQMSQVSFDRELRPILHQSNHFDPQDSLCWDISISIQEQQIYGRLIISPDLRNSWVNHFAKKARATSLSQQLSAVAPIDIRVIVGKTDLLLSEWKSIQLGDCILLDRSFLHPENLEGQVLLQLNGKTLLRAKMKQKTLKILEFPHVDEVDRMYSNSKDEDESPEEETEEVEIEEEEIEEVTEWEEEDPITEEISKTTPISTQDIPIQLIVEIGKIRMSMEKFLQLEPGNFLEIPVSPENGVDITVNGQLVGRGELVRMGEVMGVRIMELGMPHTQQNDHHG